MSLIDVKKEKELFPRRFTPSLFGSLTPLNEVLEDFWGRDYFTKMEEELSIPAVNVAEREREFEVELAAPGFKKEEINIEVIDHVLTISSKHEETKDEKDKKFTRHEFSYNAFQRSFNLPKNVNEEKIEADYKDGLLHVHIPKLETEKELSPKKINVN